MSDVAESQRKAEEVIRETDALLKEVESLVQRTDGLFESIGVNKEGVNSFLNSNRLSPAERQKADAEIAEFKEEIERDAREAVERAKAQTASSRVRVPVNRIRI